MFVCSCVRKLVNVCRLQRLAGFAISTYILVHTYKARIIMHVSVPV